MSDETSTRHPRRRGRAEDKPAHPPQPLSALTRAGKTRCQYWDMRRQDPEELESPLTYFQCGQPARAGLEVCAYHGAGSAKREKLGIRQNPATAALRSGLSARPEVLEHFLDGNPDVKDRYRRYLDAPDLLDLKPLVAWCRAMTEHFIKQADLDATEMPNGSEPPILRALSATQRTVDVVERLARIERTLGPITHAEFERSIRAVGVVIAEFVAPERVDAAYTRLRDLLRRDDRPPVGRAVPARLMSVQTGS